MKTLTNELNILDAVKNMADEFETLVINFTMSDEQKAKRIIEKALQKAQASRRQAQKMRTAMRVIKADDDPSITPLEAFEAKEAQILEVGAELTAKMQAHIGSDGKKTAKKYVEWEIQVSQLATALEDLRGNVAYVTLKDAFKTAEEAYEIALQTANRDETSYKIVESNLPMLVEAFKTYKMAQESRQDAADAAVDKFNPQTFMAGVKDDVAKARAELRSFDDVDRDLNAMEKSDPVEDILAQHDTENANTKILAEFAAAAEKLS